MFVLVVKVLLFVLVRIVYDMEGFVESVVSVVSSFVSSVVFSVLSLLGWFSVRIVSEFLCL